MVVGRGNPVLLDCSFYILNPTAAEDEGAEDCLFAYSQFDVVWTALF